MSDSVLSASDWSSIDFLSDLHLHESASGARTAAAFVEHLRTTTADAVFLLGDVFEVWVGDDAAKAGSFEAHMAEHLRACSARVFFMAGNRDFLLGDAFAQQANLSLLNDPCSLDLGIERWLLSHGDAWCLDDVDYQRFRTQVRTPQWQQALLAKPLPERQAIARAMREASANKQAQMVTHADVDHPTALQALQTHQAQVLLHGHTHRPAVHLMRSDAHAVLARAQVDEGDTQPKRRIVLSDWDLDAASPRADFVRLSRKARSSKTWHGQRWVWQALSQGFQAIDLSTEYE